MKRLLDILAIAVAGLFLSTQIGLAQSPHSEHHPNQKADSTKTATGSSMMSKDQKMMGGKGMMEGGMHGKGMMKGGMMGMMQGKGMMKGGMMGMSDPVIKTLHKSGCPRFLLMSADELELTDAQKQKLEALKLDWQKSSVKGKADIDVAKLELKEALAAPSPDFSDVKTKAEKIGDAEQKLRTTFINTVVQARKVLTPEQLAKVKDLSGNCCNGKKGMGTNK